jgi:predicted Zn finger-like uncharacterized protein
VYTQCPECGTVFRVTAQVLRAAQGQVRCGVCDANFDALRFLTDDVDLEVNAASASRIIGAPAETRAPPPAAPPRAAAPTAAPAPPRVPPAAAPADAGPPRALGGATRNRPSADEERELGEIAAILARGGQPRPTAAPPPPPPPPPPAVEPVETNVLEPADVEDIVLGEDAGSDIPDAALEFDLPAAGWDQVFVRESGETAITALDLDLANPGPPAPGSGGEPPDELVILEEHEDSLARTDEYQIPDFAAKLDAEPAPGATDIELEPTEVAELEPARVHAPAPRVPEPPAPRAARPEPGLAAQPAAERPRPSAAWRSVPLEDAHPPPPARPAAPPERSRLAAVAYTLGGVLLAAALAAQAVHYNREALAESPLIGPALSALYARLGAPIEPRWDAASYEVRQWGAQTEESAGVLRLRASIINRAARPQPYPLLRVTLEDRFGTRVGRREFTPAEYLPGRGAPREPLAPGARADADLSLADPGNQAVGFELDVCFTRHDVLICGGDAKAGGG